MNYALSNEMEPRDSTPAIELVQLQYVRPKSETEIDDAATRDGREPVTGTWFETPCRATCVLPALTRPKAPGVGDARGAHLPANSQIHAGQDALPAGTVTATSYIHPSVIVAIAGRLKQLHPLPFLELSVWRASGAVMRDSWVFRNE